ncbi:MAG: hypothetical protein JWR22_3898 [Herminiimonas sp.]|nr:hypothetical protein [Herminiimonas sp.]
MDSILPRVASAIILVVTALYAIPAHAADKAMDQAEARQLTEQFTPKAQYRLSRREAYAAYQEALQGCRQNGKADRPCTQEAKRQLQEDLTDASQYLRRDDSVGSSGTAGSSSGTESSAGSVSRPTGELPR